MNNVSKSRVLLPKQTLKHTLCYSPLQFEKWTKNTRYMIYTFSWMTTKSIFGFHSHVEERRGRINQYTQYWSQAVQKWFLLMLVSKRLMAWVVLCGGLGVGNEGREKLTHSVQYLQWRTGCCWRWFPGDWRWGWFSVGSRGGGGGRNQHTQYSTCSEELVAVYTGFQETGSGGGPLWGVGGRRGPTHSEQYLQWRTGCCWHWFPGDWRRGWSSVRGEGWRAPPAGTGSTEGSSRKPGAVPARSDPVAARARSSCCPRPPSLLQVYMLVYMY